MKIVKQLLIFFKNLPAALLMSYLVHAIHPIISKMFLEGLLWDSNANATVMKSLLFVAMIKNKNKNKSYVIKNWWKCDICKNYLISNKSFLKTYKQEILYQ